MSIWRCIEVSHDFGKGRTEAVRSCLAGEEDDNVPCGLGAVSTVAIAATAGTIGSADNQE